jgi:hypothetical protein
MGMGSRRQIEVESTSSHAVERRGRKRGGKSVYETMGIEHLGHTPGTYTWDMGIEHLGP